MNERTKPNSAPNPDQRPMSPADEAPSGTVGTGEAMCSRCGGSGMIGTARCPDCEGTGKVTRAIGGA